MDRDARSRPAHARFEAGRSSLSAYLGRLEATGRADAAADLRRRDADHLP